MEVLEKGKMDKIGRDSTGNCDFVRAIFRLENLLVNP